MRHAAGVAEVLATYGVPSYAIERERFAMSAVQYARTDDRSNVGVLTAPAPASLYDLPRISMMELPLRLARTPIVARNLFPVIETCRVFGVAPPARVQCACHVAASRTPNTKEAAEAAS